MNIEKITAYHCTNKESAQSIIDTQKFFPSTKEKGHWLGGGVYFYIDIYFAIQWAIIGVLKKTTVDTFEEIKNKSDILSADINFSNYNVLDLTVPEGYEIFLSFLEYIKETKGNEEYEKAKNKGDIYIIKMLEIMEREENIETFSSFDIVYAEYNDTNVYKKVSEKKSDFLVCIEKQICVKNINAITNINKIEFSDNEKISFDIIKKNRRCL